MSYLARGPARSVGIDSKANAAGARRPCRRSIGAVVEGPAA